MKISSRRFCLNGKVWNDGLCYKIGLWSGQVHKHKASQQTRPAVALMPRLCDLMEYMTAVATTTTPTIHPMWRELCRFPFLARVQLYSSIPCHTWHMDGEISYLQPMDRQER